MTISGKTGMLNKILASESSGHFYPYDHATENEISAEVYHHDRIVQELRQCLEEARMSLPKGTYPLLLKIDAILKKVEP